MHVNPVKQQNCAILNAEFRRDLSLQIEWWTPYGQWNQQRDTNTDSQLDPRPWRFVTRVRQKESEAITNYSVNCLLSSKKAIFHIKIWTFGMSTHSMADGNTIWAITHVFLGECGGFFWSVSIYKSYSTSSHQVLQYKKCTKQLSLYCHAFSLSCYRWLLSVGPVR